jgi:hypothetical protein
MEEDPHRLRKTHLDTTRQRRKGWLIGALDGRPAPAARIPGEKLMRLYRVSSAILSTGYDEEADGGSAEDSRRPE